MKFDWEYASFSPTALRPQHRAAVMRQIKLPFSMLVTLLMSRRALPGALALPKKTFRMNCLICGAVNMRWLLRFN